MPTYLEDSSQRSSITPSRSVTFKTFSKSSAATSRKPTLTSQECALRQVMAISQPASHSLGIPTEIRGIRPRPARSIGGFRYTRSNQTMRWHFIRVTGANRSRIALLDIITTPGTRCTVVHSSVPNTSGLTRFSIDFRTVHVDDVVAKRGRRTSIRHALEPSCGTTCAARISRGYRFFFPVTCTAQHAPVNFNTNATIDHA
jgi:hypothetical protein